MGGLPGGGSYNTVFNSGDDAILEFSLIVETMNGVNEQQTVQFVIAGTSAMPTVLHVWLTLPNSLFQRLTDVPVINATFVLDIPANCTMSVTTTTGQGWLTPSVIPATQPFPFPFSEDFSGSDVNTTARCCSRMRSTAPSHAALLRYWSAMGGGWLLQVLPMELVASKPRAVSAQGKASASEAPPAAAAAVDTAYRQMVPAAPGPNGWKGDPNPCAVVGNPSSGEHGVVSWTDYELIASGAIDASVPMPLSARDGVMLWVAGRIESWGWDYVAQGYNLTVWASVAQEEAGWWALSAGAQVNRLRHIACGSFVVHAEPHTRR